MDRKKTHAHTLLILVFLFISISCYSQPVNNEVSKKRRPLDHFVGYYDVGIKPNKPFFKSRWYIRNGKLFAIFDADQDREIDPFNSNNSITNWIKFVNDERQIIENDSIYYVIPHFENNKLKSFIIKRPRKEWASDLYGYRNEKLSHLAVDTEAMLNHQVKTEHFDFYFTDIDTANVPQFATRFENKYDELMEQFELEGMPRTAIRIYPDLSTYHNAVLTPGAPKWQMGRAWQENQIRMVSTTFAQKIIEMPFSKDIPLHEYIHCIHLKMKGDNQNIVHWLWEGIAMYKGCCKWVTPNELKYLKKGKMPSLKKIENNNEKKYELGYFLVEFIDKKWGWKSVLNLIKSNGDVETELNTSAKDFEKSFYEYIQKEYLSK